MSKLCSDLAHQVTCGDGTLSEGPEMTAGLRKLLEAKDCFVRAAIMAAKEGAAR